MALFPKKSKNPTRQTTGTSYSSKGAATLKPADLQEHGSSRSSQLRDVVPALGNDFQAALTYTGMTRSDASVRSSLRAGKTPVLGAEYFMEPFSKDPEDLAINEFVDFNIFSGTTITFLKTLEQVLKMYESPKGNSVFEPAWEIREWAPKLSTPGANRRNYTMLRKLGYRPSSTITEFMYDDNGGPAGVKHNAQRADNTIEEVEIPIDKLVIFTFDPDGGGIEGTSILRSAYRHWFYKDHFYKIDGVQKERHSIGVPYAELQPGFDDDDKAFANEMLRNLRTNERGYFLTTTMVKVGFAELTGLIVNPLESAMHHDTQIMKNILVQFLNAGVDSSGGGRATSATAFDMFLKAMEYVANTICACYNMYVIPQLVAYNFKTDRFPKMKVRKVGQAKDLALFANAMANLKAKGAITFDTDTENWLRQQLNMPDLIGDRPAEVVANNNPAPQDQATNDNGKKNGKPPTGQIGKSPSSGVV